MNEVDVVVLGAGISGLVSTSILLAQGAGRVLVVDEYDHVGGNHIDWSSDGYTFDIGSLIFQDDSPLLEHFPEIRPFYVPIDPSWGRLNPQCMITGYPISIVDDVLRAGPLEVARIFASLLYARLFQRRMNNAKDFARFWIGQRLLWRTGLETYMQRICGVSAEEIDVDLAFKRMGWISENGSVRNVIRKLLRAREARTPNRQLVRPQEGFGVLYAPAVEKLKASGATFRLSADIRSIRRDGDWFLIEFNDRTVATKRLVSTIPIQRTEELCGIVRDDHLDTVTLICLYYSFSGNRGFRQSIIYNFSHEGAWKRLTVYSDFYGRVRGREYFGVEVVGHHASNSVTEAETNFRNHMRASGLFDGDLKLEGAQKLDNAYPIYSRGAAQRAEAAIRVLRAFGIESIGRQGGFNYQPTARASTVEAEAVLRHGASGGDAAECETSIQQGASGRSTAGGGPDERSVRRGRDIRTPTDIWSGD